MNGCVGGGRMEELFEGRMTRKGDLTIFKVGPIFVDFKQFSRIIKMNICQKEVHYPNQFIYDVHTFYHQVNEESTVLRSCS